MLVFTCQVPLECNSTFQSVMPRRCSGFDWTNQVLSNNRIMLQ